MHDFSMPQWAIDRVMERRGKLHIHDDIDPTKTALIVVDLQNGFMVPEHSPNPVPTAIETVPYVNRLAEALRATGGKVFWIKNTVNETNRAEWSHFFAMSKPEFAGWSITAFEKGAPGHDIYPGLEVLPDDEIVLKHRFSAFLPASSNLTTLLREQGYDTVLIAGTVTNVCCESSARDAMMENFKTIMVSDGNSARTDEEHTATLAAFYAVFGDVMTTTELIDVLHANQKSALASAT